MRSVWSGLAAPLPHSDIGRYYTGVRRCFGDDGETRIGPSADSNNIAAMRREIEAAEFVTPFDENGTAAVIARQNVAGDAPSLRFDKSGDWAGILRRL